MALLMTAMSQARLGALGSAGDWWDLASTMGDRYGVDPSLILATIDVESGGDPTAINPRDPSYGLGQVMVPTARQFVPGISADDLLDPETNVSIVARYLRDQLDRYNGDVPSAVAAYNAGTARRDASGNFTNQSYVDRVLAALGAAVTPDVADASDSPSSSLDPLVLVGRYPWATVAVLALLVLVTIRR